MIPQKTNTKQGEIWGMKPGYLHRREFRWGFNFSSLESFGFRRERRHEVEGIKCKPRSLGQESYNLGTREKCLHEIEKTEDNGRQININI